MALVKETWTIYAWYKYFHVYVGKTTDTPTSRMSRHKSDARKDKLTCYRTKFLRKLIDNNEEPHLVILEQRTVIIDENISRKDRNELSRQTLDPLEIKWIAYFRRRKDFITLNGTNGGSSEYKLTEDSKRHQSQAQKGRVFSEETKKLMSESQQKRCADPVERERRRQMMFDFLATEEGQAQLKRRSEEQKGQPSPIKGIKKSPLSEDLKKRISEIKLQWFKDNPEASKKQAEKRIGLPQSEETRKKRGDAMRDLYETEEYVANFKNGIQQRSENYWKALKETTPIIWKKLLVSFLNWEDEKIDIWIESKKEILEILETQPKLHKYPQYFPLIEILKSLTTKKVTQAKIKKLIDYLKQPIEDYNQAKIYIRETII